MVDFRRFAGAQGGTGILGGLISGLGNVGSNQLRQDQLARQQQQDIIGALRVGIDPTRLQDQAYLQEVAQANLSRANRPIGTSEFERLVVASGDESLPQAQRDLINARLQTISRDPTALFAQAQQSELGKLKAQQQVRPELEADIKESTLEAQRGVERAGAAREALRGVEDISAAGENINRILEDNPELAGGYSPIRGTASRFDLPGGFSEEQQEARGELTRNLSALQNKALALATQAGQSGINIQAEVDRITQGLQPTSTPAEIKGAIRAMIETQERLARQLGGVQQQVGAPIQETQQVIDNNDPLGLR